MKYKLGVFKHSALHHCLAWSNTNTSKVCFAFNIYIVYDSAGLKNTRSVGIFKLVKEGEGQPGPG